MCSNCSRNFPCFPKPATWYTLVKPVLKRPSHTYSLNTAATTQPTGNDRSGECERIINGLSFCEQNAVLERLRVDVTISNDGTCSDWSFSDSEENRVRLMEGWCSSSNAHHNAAMEFYTDGSLLVASGDSSQASFDKGERACFGFLLGHAYAAYITTAAIRSR